MHPYKQRNFSQAALCVPLLPLYLESASASYRLLIVAKLELRYPWKYRGMAQSLCCSTLTWRRNRYIKRNYPSLRNRSLSMYRSSLWLFRSRTWISRLATISITTNILITLLLSCLPINARTTQSGSAHSLPRTCRTPIRDDLRSC